jgi:hypothetical protein
MQFDVGFQFLTKFLIQKLHHGEIYCLFFHGKNKCRLSVMMDFITVAKCAQVYAGMLVFSAGNLLANGRATLLNI